ncbi:pilus assembly protein CpaF [Lachnospiraceae bacterium C10]|nr:pilus assembly protein CpaF [Lachnospiraceae bacterium C10]
MNKEDTAYEKLAAKLCEEFHKKQSAGLLANLEKRNLDALDVSREKILTNMKSELGLYENEKGESLSEEEKAHVLELIRKDLWGYGIIDDLIHESDISDIKLYAPENVRVKRTGKRFGSGITFTDVNTYKRFVNKMLERNKINLGTANAIQTFTDATQEDAILRITIISGLLTDSGLPLVAIRKVPKTKYTLKSLEDAGMFNHKASGKSGKRIKINTIPVFFSDENAELNSLMYKMILSKGILFTGKGASGKTTLMNAMIAEIPYDESVMICQENAELFDNKHPDLFSAHVLTNAGDSKISYELGDLTRAALLVDLDRVIVGEVKEGSEAAGLSKASMTGHKCWTSVHGESCEMAVDKMADYISQATGYSTRDSLKQLQGFEYVVHLKNFRVDEIIRIAGWDKEKETLIFEKVYPIVKEGA